jgi:hypothetical protein
LYTCLFSRKKYTHSSVTLNLSYAIIWSLIQWKAKNSRTVEIFFPKIIQTMVKSITLTHSQGRQKSSHEMTQIPIYAIIPVYIHRDLDHFVLWLLPGPVCDRKMFFFCTVISIKSDSALWINTPIVLNQRGHGSVFCRQSYVTGPAPLNPNLDIYTKYIYSPWQKVVMNNIYSFLVSTVLAKITWNSNSSITSCITLDFSMMDLSMKVNCKLFIYPHFNAWCCSH